MQNLDLHQKKLFASLVGLLGLLVLNALFLKYNAFRCFNFLDMGSFLDAGWRVFIGQRPYLDFIYYTGPLHLYIHSFFFKLLGFGMTAILTHLVLVHSLVIIVVFAMLYNRVPIAVNFLVTILTIPSFYWSISHPWHDQNAHLWGIIGLSLMIQNFPFSSSRRAFENGLICAGLCVVSFITKTNIGVAYGVFLFSVLMCSPLRRPALTGWVGGVFIFGILALGVIGHPHEYLRQCAIHSRAVAHDRLWSLLDPRVFFLNYYWVPLVIVLVNTLTNRLTLNRRVGLLVGITAVGIFAANSGGTIKPANNFLWGVQMAVAMVLMFELKTRIHRPSLIKLWQISILLLVLLTITLTAIAVRYGIELKVWTYIKRSPIGDYKIRTEPLEGWRCLRYQGEALDGIAKILHRPETRTQTFLNLSDMYILYALTGRDSFPGMPFLFLQDILPAGEQIEEVRQNIVRDLPDWMVIDLDSFKTEIRYLRLEEILRENYDIFGRWNVYLLLRKK